VGGTNSIVAKDTDAAGNTGSSTPVVFTLDTVPPTVAISTAGGLTNQASQTISGTVTSTEATPGATVTLYDNGSQIGTAPLSNGSWTTTVTLVGGTNSIVAKDTDAAGNTGSSTPVVFTLETASPTVSVSISNTDVNTANPTGTVTFTFSEAPTSFTLANTSTVGGTLSGLTKVTATDYTATFTASANTDINSASVSVTAGSWQSNGIPGSGGSTPNFVVDTVTPTVPEPWRVVECSVTAVCPPAGLELLPQDAPPEALAPLQSRTCARGRRGRSHRRTRSATI
jgi:Bacterial Ig-like domain